MFTLLYHVKNIYQALLQNFMYKFYNEIYANKKQKRTDSVFPDAPRNGQECQRKNRPGEGAVKEQSCLRVRVSNGAVAFQLMVNL